MYSDQHENRDGLGSSSLIVTAVFTYSGASNNLILFAISLGVSRQMTEIMHRDSLLTCVAIELPEVQYMVGENDREVHKRVEYHMKLMQMLMVRHDQQLDEKEKEIESLRARIESLERNTDEIHGTSV